MESNSIELKVISCNDLKAFNFFQKLSVYAVVSIVNDNQDKKKQKLQQQRTPIDRKGDGNPEWNHEMRFDLKEISFLDCDGIYLQFHLRCDGIVFGEKTIGEVRVPFKDLIDEFNGAVRFVNYQVRNSEGKSNGVLRFSYKINDKEEKMGSYQPANGSALPDNFNDGSPVVNPSEEVHYPSVDVESPSPGVHYPSVDVHYPPQEAYYPAAPEYYYNNVPAPPPPPPPPPPPHPPGTYVAYYPPPPPPPPPAVIYIMRPPDPYGYRSGGYGYPTAGQ